jgi:hypothetical protein
MMGLGYRIFRNIFSDTTQLTGANAPACKNYFSGAM